jgi:hypothetical protein
MNERLQDALAEILDSMRSLIDDMIPEDRYEQHRNDLEDIDRQIKAFKKMAR